MKPQRETSLRLPFNDPSIALSDFEQLLISNSSEDAFDIAIGLLAAKLLDEVETLESHRTPSFSLDGSPPDVYKRIQRLYESAVTRWPDLNGTLAKKLEVGQHQLLQCLRPLLGWTLMGSDLSHLDAVLERLVARSAKAELGQYFTPRPVIRMCVEALAPNYKDVVIDPACGSGGFLYEAVQHCLRNRERPPKCLGIDLGAKAIRVACLLSHVIGEDTIVISRGNSLDGRDYRSSYPGEWEPFLIKDSRGHSAPSPWGAWHRLQCSVLLTNPPFAGAIDDADVLASYESQRQPGALRRGSAGREHLFVDRAISMLSPGGRLAIVVPQGILANATASYLRKWVLSRCRILAVVGLHPYTFLPNTGVKASVMFLEKAKDRVELQGDYDVLFAVSKLPGKDSRGRLAGNSDYQEIGNCLQAHFGSLGKPWAKSGTDAASLVSHSVVPVSEVIQHDRMDAEYYDPGIRSLHRAMRRNTNQCISDVVAPTVQRFRANTTGEIEYIDISAVDGRTGIPVPSRMDSSDAPSRASYVLKEGDVLVSTVRPERNVVALVNRTSDLPIVASNGFCVLRSTAVPPELLFAYCKTESFRRLLSRRATATMYPAVTDGDVLQVPFIQTSEKVQQEVVENIQAGIKLLEKAYSKIGLAIEEMERYLKSELEPSLSRTEGSKSRRAIRSRNRPG